MTEKEQRQALLECALAMNSQGLNQGSSGNVSLRLQEGMLITPSALPYHRCTPEDMVLVSWDGVAQGSRQPSSEWRMHHDIYLAYKQAQCILHAHAPWSSTLACLQRPIPAQHYMVALAGGEDIRCTPYAPFGTQELSDVAVAGLQSRSAVLLGHHGLICYAECLDQVLVLACEVEFLARVYGQSLQITPEPPLLSSDAITSLLERFSAYKQLGQGKGNLEE